MTTIISEWRLISESWHHMDLLSIWWGRPSQKASLQVPPLAYSLECEVEVAEAKWGMFSKGDSSGDDSKLSWVGAVDIGGLLSKGWDDSKWMWVSTVVATSGVFLRSSRSTNKTGIKCECRMKQSQQNKTKSYKVRQKHSVQLTQQKIHKRGKQMPCMLSKQCTYFWA